MKLQFKINLLSTLLTLLLFICSFTGIYYFYQYLAFKTEFEQLQTRADEMVVALSGLDNADNIEAVLRSYLPTNGLIHIVDENDQTIFRIQGTSNAQKIEYDIEDDDSYTISHWHDTPVMAIQYPIIWPDERIFSIHLVQPLSEIDEQLTLLRWVLVIITLLAIIPIYFASQAIVRITATPIKRLTETMQRNTKLARYDKHDIQSRNKDEIAQMTHSYNLLMEKLEENYIKQQQFVGNASHELKTPLTVIESYAKLLQRRGFENEQVNNEALTAITQQTAQMKAMMAQMLQLARANENMQMTWTTVSTNDVLNPIIKSIEQAYARHITVTGDATLVSDAEMLTQLLFILLDNARKYSEDDIQVIVQDGPHVTITVQDRGIGIPSEDIPHIFDRFYRVAKDRNRRTGGTGLGLAIAKSFTQALHGTIDVESELGIGTKFIVTLPKEGPANAK